MLKINKCIRCLLLSCFVLINCFYIYGLSEAASLWREQYAPVLMYHDIKLTPVNGFDVSRDDFARQLDWLQENGYQTLSMDEYINGINEGGFDSNAVLITFDDGYEGVYLYALPELKKRNMKATLFIITNNIGNTSKPQYPFISLAQLYELAEEPLISLGSHSKTHPDFCASKWDTIIKELESSRDFLEQITGRSCRALSYPYANYNLGIIKAVQAVGYEAAFAVETRGSFGEDTRYSIPRIYMGTVMGENDLYLFKRSVRLYKRLPNFAFAERYVWFKNK